MKLKYLNTLKNMVIKAIDDNQEIKRYCKYYTSTPTLSTGLDNHGNIKEQPDINESLVGKNIIPYMFYEDLLVENRVFIFCYYNRGNLTNVVGKNRFFIDVVAPVELNFLEGGIGEERIASIADLITDTLDGKRLSNAVTEIRFTDYTCWRVFRGNTYIGITLGLEMTTSNLREV